MIRSLRGYSLIELMVAMALTGFVLAGAFELHSVYLRQAGRQEQIIDMQQSLRVAKNVIEAALRQSGAGLADGQLIVHQCGGAADHTYYGAQFYNGPGSNALDYVVPNGYHAANAYDTTTGDADTDPDWLQVIVPDVTSAGAVNGGYFASAGGSPIVNSQTGYAVNDYFAVVNTGGAQSSRKACVYKATALTGPGAGTCSTCYGLTYDAADASCMNKTVVNDTTCMASMTYPAPVKRLTSQSNLFYWVDTSDTSTPKLKVWAGKVDQWPSGAADSSWQTIAENIEDLQVAYVMNDGRVCGTSTNSVDDPALCDPRLARAVRFTLVARTSSPVQGAANLAQVPAIEDRAARAVSDYRLRRALTTEVALRNAPEPNVCATAIAGGYNHSCAVMNDTTVRCWGDNSLAQLGDNTLTNRWVPGPVVDSGGAGTLSGVTSLSAGTYATCAVKTDGTAWCWGYNRVGELGINTSGITSYRAYPSQVVDVGGTGTLTNVSAISTAGGTYGHTCALKSDGSLVWCWGENGNGQLGDNTTTDRSSPIVVVDSSGTGTLSSVSQVANLQASTCALKTNGSVWCWGLNGGKLGNNSTVDSVVPVQVVGVGGSGVLSGISQIGAHAAAVCAMSSAGNVYCWGQGSMSELGNNNTVASSFPVQVVDTGGTGTLGNVTSIPTSSSGHTCALKSDNTLWCWGSAQFGSLGDNSLTSKAAPVEVVANGGTGTLTPVNGVSAGAYQTLASTKNGKLWAWGWNNKGQLGDNTTTNRTSPVQVKNISTCMPTPTTTPTPACFTSLGEGRGLTSCAVASDNTAWCWGWNAYGQVGDNTATDRWVPTQVVNSTGSGSLSNVAALAGGYDFWCALKSDNTVWCWGRNTYGQLGDNTATNRALPVHVRDTGGTGTLSGVAAISPGQSFSCALKKDGTVWCWGYGANGRLGNNLVTDSKSPVEVVSSSGTGTLTNIAAISSGMGHACALRADNTVWCWGVGTNGQLGNNATASTNVAPVQVRSIGGSGTLTGVAVIGSRYVSTCARLVDNTVRCWGLSYLGDNTANQATSPVNVVSSSGTGTLANVLGLSGHSGSGLGDEGCSFKTDGTVWCWGITGTYGNLGNNAIVDSAKPVGVVAAGGTGTLTGISALSSTTLQHLAGGSSGTLWAWGYNVNGQLGDNTTTNRTSPVAVTNATACITAPTPCVTRMAGFDHVCGQLLDGTMRCWGQNTNGALGDNTNVARYLPALVLSEAGSGTLAGVVSMDTGSQASCALKSDGTARCWGTNWSSRYPTAVSDSAGTGTLSGIASIVSGNSGDACFLLSDTTIWCRGNNQYGQLGNNMSSASFSTNPSQVVGPAGTGTFLGAATVSGGGGYFCSRRLDGSVWCWGENNFGQLGNNATTDRYAPVRVHGPGDVDYLSSVTAISSSKNNKTCAVRADGTAWCWAPTAGATGDVPALVSQSGGGTLSDISGISTGSNHICSFKSDGTAWCWRTGSFGRLGNNSAADSTPAVRVVASGGSGTLSPVNAIAATDYSSLACTNDTRLWAWGWNGQGELGNNTTDSNNHTSPEQVTALTSCAAPVPAVPCGIYSIAMGNGHSCVVKSDNTAWCWGRNDRGQLGDNTTTARIIPVQVRGVGGTGTLTNVATVSAGTYFTCALKLDGTVWCWGYNNYGTLGDNTFTDRITPSWVRDTGGSGTLQSIGQLSAGIIHTCATKTNGTVWCWGTNSSGELGDNTNSNRYAPVQVVANGGGGALTGIAMVSAGAKDSNGLTCATTTDGKAWCWGHNDWGQLGNNTTTNSKYPVQVVDTGGTGTLSGLVKVAASYYYSCGLKADGTVWCWGNNYYGNLGNNSATWGAQNVMPPVRVVTIPGASTLTNVVDIANQIHSTCALRSDNSVWCWGSGNLGNNEHGARQAGAVMVNSSSGTGTLTSVMNIGAGSSARGAIAVTSDNKLWAWGDNLYGGLGNNTTFAQDAPAQVFATSLCSSCAPNSCSGLNCGARVSDGCGGSIACMTCASGTCCNGSCCAGGQVCCSDGCKTISGTACSPSCTPPAYCISQTCCNMPSYTYCQTGGSCRTVSSMNDVPDNCGGGFSGNGFDWVCNN